MKTTITAQQASFFTQNGYIEFEGIPFDPDSLFESCKNLLASRLKIDPVKLSQKTPLDLYTAGRDLWRQDSGLQTLLLRKVAPIAMALTSKNQLRLACDQWIPAETTWEKPFPSKELFSIQGVAICFIISTNASPLPRRSPLGLLPLPSNPTSILFFKPEILLDWPRLKRIPPIDLYLASYALPNSLYIQNPKDPCTNLLKQFGYEFGDPLKNEFHPIVK